MFVCAGYALGTVPNALQQFYKISFFRSLLKYCFSIIAPCIAARIKLYINCKIFLRKK